MKINNFKFSRTPQIQIQSRTTEPRVENLTEGIEHATQIKGAEMEKNKIQDTKNQKASLSTHSPRLESLYPTMNSTQSDNSTRRMQRRCFKNTLNYEKDDIILRKTIVNLWHSALKNAELHHDCVYDGKAGELYWLTQMLTRCPLPGMSNKAEFIAKHLGQKIQTFSSYHKSHATSVLCGFAGEVLATWYYLYKTKQLEDSLLQKCEDVYSKLCVQSATASHSVNEILYGRAGLLLGCSILARGGVDTRGLRIQLIRRIVQDGKDASTKESPPLAYSWHGKQYIGAAHGYAGVLFALLSNWSDVPERYHDDIRRTVDWMVSLITANSNVPSSVSDSFHICQDKDHLVHWCHGAPGIVPTLCKAWEVFGDPVYLSNARLLAETTWEHGLLRKGWGICHGAARNGYSFLSLYYVTKDTCYLKRAEQFAMWIARSSESNSTMYTPDEPLGLYTGVFGGSLFLSDIMTGHHHSSLPFLDALF